MDDDLNTAHVLTGAFQEALKFINGSLNSLKKKQQKQQQLSMIQSLVDVEKEVKDVLGILGLLSPSTYSELLQQLKDKALRRAELVEDDVLWLIEERTQARKNKDFSRSDQIRADLTVKGIAIMDVGKETIWRPCVSVEFEQPAVLDDHKQQPTQPVEQEQNGIAQSVEQEQKGTPVSTKWYLNLDLPQFVLHEWCL